MSKPSPHVILTSQVPGGGKAVRIALDASERRALAAELGIVDVIEASAEFRVRPVGAEAYGVQGSLTATVVQNDVVTLEPLTQAVSEDIDLTLSPEDDAVRRTKGASAQDSPERDTYANGRIDLGAIMAEHLALGLDPYPRAEGVQFPGHVEDDPAKDESPFAALARLKKPE